jgi:hypothetical protein
MTDPEAKAILNSYGAPVNTGGSSQKSGSKRTRREWKVAERKSTKDLIGY